MKSKLKTPHNKRGFYTKNNTQIFKKDHFGTEQALAETTEDTPSGEQGLPDIH